jgi:hypothetical protein
LNLSQAKPRSSNKLKLLLDEHISPTVALGIIRRNPTLEVHCLSEWENGIFRGKDDSVFLQVAAKRSLTLVTYDRRTITPLLKVWAEEGRFHGGVIFVDEKSISQADIGGLVRALTELINEMGSWNWTNRTHYLQP